MPFFRVSFSPIFSGTGYQNKASFLDQVVKTCQKGKFCSIGLSFSPFFFVFEYTFHRFFLEQGIIWRQKFWSRVKKYFFVGTSPYKFRSSNPPGKKKIFRGCFVVYRSQRWEKRSVPINDPKKLPPNFKSEKVSLSVYCLARSVPAKKRYNPTDVHDVWCSL